MGSAPLSLTQVAVIALAVGLVVGGGIAVVIALSLRARARVQAVAEATVPSELTAALGAMEDATALFDPSGTVVAASPSAAQLGLVAGDVPEQPELREIVKRVRLGKGDQNETLRIRRGRIADDTRLVVARAVRIADRLTLLTVRDITEQERLQQMRQDFIANTSHELKTPVGAIGLLAEAMEMASDDPEQVKKFAARMSVEARRLGELTGRIMNLSRLQAGDEFTEVEVVAIDEVVAAAIERHQVQADSADVALVRGGDRRLSVRGSSGILIEALSNLIANAIAYSPQGSRVGIGVRGTEDAVEIAVTDQGIGIPESEQQRVFERFYRADQARSRRTGGTGLGLSIVKHAVSRHGGEVRLWSQPERGSTFTIRLPRIEQASADDEHKTRKNKKKGAEAA